MPDCPDKAAALTPTIWASAGLQTVLRRGHRQRYFLFYQEVVGRRHAAQAAHFYARAGRSAVGRGRLSPAACS